MFSLSSYPATKYNPLHFYKHTHTAKMTTTYQQQQLQGEEEDDLFDLLPDPILLEIFNRVHDANSLSTSTSTCKRFAKLIPQVNTLHLNLPSPTTKNPLLPTHNNTPIKGFIHKIIIKPIQSILHAISPKKSSSSSYCTQCDNDDVSASYHLPNQILKNFNEIQSLRLQLPKNRGDISSNSGDALLKWKAEFGSELQSCVILAANSFHKVEHRMFDRKEEEESCFTNDALKLRVVWTISCLIAASARHHLLKQILSEHPAIRDVEIRDGSKQGRICMKEDQVEELRKGMVDEFGELGEMMERTKVPALRMKMWYVGELELAESGFVLKGATLVVIRPAPGEERSAGGGDDGELAMGAFDGEEKWFGEAARKMIKKKKNAFTLEMNSF